MADDIPRSLEERWATVDEHVERVLIGTDPALTAALRESAAAGLPSISVMPAHGKFLQILARSRGAHRILEIGTLGGYSAIWLARSLAPGGHLITIEADPAHAAVARASLERAGVLDRVDLRVGPALDVLPQIAGESATPFDLVFIDADKANTAEYFSWALELTRVGSLIVVDNVVRGGAVADAATDDPSARAMRRFLETLAAEPRVSATVIQTVGAKGYDGFAFALVTS
jgi:predicted O-methyltransferase YrrM